jgi:cellulose synthase/poly-beta-1,6-N-acetylglucosamine synthase-like glycosyltransferase
MVTFFLESLFFLTIFLCLSSYALYPLIIMLIGMLFPFKPIKNQATPTVSILIAAYNEEKDIHEKLDNTLALDYPKEKIEIIVGSDGSSDRTSEIVSRFSDKGVKLLDFKQNRGKTAVQNDLVAASQSDILVFTDAASFLRQDSLRNIVQSFADKRVGGVAGCMEFVADSRNLTTESQGLYWKYEKKLREIESSIGRLIGVDGPLYAVRRENYVPLMAHIISDLMTPLLVLKQGKKIVLEKDALVLEAPTTESRQELATRRRITLRGLVGLFSQPELLSPIHFPLTSFQIIFHKFVRWCVGPLVLLNLFICLLLSGSPFFRLFLFFHLMFYLAACVGVILEKIERPITAFKVPYYFCLVNLAATLGLIDFIKKKQAVSWKPVRK